MLKRSFSILLLLLNLIALAPSYSQTTVYVNPTTGSDTNPGTIVSPFRTITKGVASIPGGGIVYLRGGTYSISGTTRITLSAVGTATSMYRLWAYPGEVPVIDFSTQTNFGEIMRGGIELSGQYWHLKGIREQNNYNREGCILTGSHNIVENCSFRRNGLNAEGSGLMLYGRSDAPANAHDNLILNCDSYDNFSGTGNGGNSDGFNAIYNIGTGNVFRGCRSWNNSDDGFDCWGSTQPVLFDSCYSFGNGLANGNGQGFKMGGNSTQTQSAAHVWTNCIAANNKKHGFDQNTNRAGQTLYNCTSYHNGGANYLLSTVPTSGSHIVKNCVSYLGSMSNAIQSPNTQATNSWQGFTVNSADFVSLDSTGEAGRQRNPGGSLPASNFLRLAPGSDLLSAGTNVGIPFPGTKPNVGAFGIPGAPDPLPPPAVPGLLTPSSGALIDPPTLMERWRKVTGAVFYHLQVSESSTFQNYLVNDSTLVDTLRLVGSLRSGVTYYTRIRAEGTSSWSSFGPSVQFTTTMAAPAAPLVLSPVPSTTIDPPTVTVRWRGVTGAATYHLQVDAHSDFQSPLVSDSTLVDTLRQVGSLQGCTTYNVRVRAKGATSAWSIYSAAISFTTTAAPPEVIDPEKGSKGHSTSFNSRWNRSPGATLYHIQIADNISFQSPVLDDSTLSDTLREVSLLKENTQYYLRVRAKGGSVSQWGLFGPVVDFTTGAVSSSGADDGKIPAMFSLAQNYPNPFNPSTTIRFGLPTRAHVRLTVFNSLGQLVRNLMDTDQEAGYFEVRLDGANLASGIYYYRLQANEYINSRKLVLVK